jgi:hypothetical protein
VIAPLLVSMLLAVAPVFPGVAPPPAGTFEEELTRIASERAMHELKDALAKLDRDTTIPESKKREIRRKTAKVRLALYTTPKTPDELVTFYEQSIRGATFVYSQRDILTDLQEVARVGGLTLDPAVTGAWQGKTGMSARWSRDDGSLEIDIEDYLIDPRDAKVTRKTVVLITSAGE